MRQLTIVPLAEDILNSPQLIILLAVWWHEELVAKVKGSVEV